MGTASTKALRWEHGQGLEEWRGWRLEPSVQRGKEKVHPLPGARLNLSPRLPSMSPSPSAPWQVDKKFIKVADRACQLIKAHSLVSAWRAAQFAPLPTQLVTGDTG